MKIFRASSWLIAFGGTGCLIGIAALAAVIRTDGKPAFVALGSMVVAVMVLGFLDLLTTRIVLKAEGMEVVSHFRRRFIPRADINSVTWERGSGVSLALTSGKWMRLPEIGRNSQAQVNSIRAWLKRAPMDHRDREEA